MSATTEDVVRTDCLVIGAGFGGLRMLFELRQRGFSGKVLEAGTDVGGTWYWNRYPGARTDSESWVYCFSFDDDLQQEWDWQERFPAQPEVLSYLGHVTDRFDLRRDIEFSTRVARAVYDEETAEWAVTTEDGREFRSTFLVTATGPLSLPLDPPFPGLDDFRGDWYLTARWPKEPVDLRGKRVGIVGTGATAVQVIPLVAEQAEHLTVFQRTPNFVIPARNRRLTDDERQAIKERYDAIWDQTQRQVFAFPMEAAGRIGSDVAADDVQGILEDGWRTGGFQFLFETFDDLLVNEELNEATAEFIRSKIRETVDDPETAELLSPKGYPVGGKRPPLGHGYYETYNRPNVELVDINNAPIERITASGLRTAAAEYDFDVLIFATGFDAMTGTLMAIDIVGREGQTIRQRWEQGPETYLGLAVDGFPNLFMISAPQSPFANIPVVIDNAVKWIGTALTHVEQSGLRTFEPTTDAVQEWCALMNTILDATLLGRGERVNSWFLGANVPGKPHVVLFYFGGANNYFDTIHGVAARGYEGFESSSAVAAVG